MCLSISLFGWAKKEGTVGGEHARKSSLAKIRTRVQWSWKSQLVGKQEIRRDTAPVVTNASIRLPCANLYSCPDPLGNSRIVRLFLSFMFIIYLRSSRGSRFSRWATWDPPTRHTDIRHCNDCHQVSDQNNTADWCTTQFTRALAVASGCQLHNVTALSSQAWAASRSKTTSSTYDSRRPSLSSLSLVFEVFDLVILLLVRGTKRWRGAKMKRPWFTMSSGNIVLLVLIIVGVFQCQHLLRKIDQSVTVFEYQKGLEQSVTCIAHLTPYGMWGAIWSMGTGARARRSICN
jgi:hypothetical protein